MCTDHFTTLTVDRSLSITYPVWHHAQNWKQLNPKISCTITIFYSITSVQALFAVYIENDACVTRKNWYFTIYRIIFGVFFFAGTHFLLLLISSVTFIFQLYKHRSSKLSHRQENPGIQMEHLNVHSAITTADNQVEGTANDGNHGKFGKVGSSSTVADTASPVFDRVFFLTIVCKKNSAQDVKSKM